MLVILDNIIFGIQKADRNIYYLSIKLRFKRIKYILTYLVSYID